MKLLVKILNSIFLILLVLLLIIFVILFSFIIKNSFLSEIDFGTVPDWLSTIANIIMACVAVFAAYKARNLLSPKLHNDAYDLSKKIIVFQMHDLIILTSSTLGTCFDIRKLILDEVKSIKEIGTELDILLEKIRSLQTLQSSIEADFRIMNKLGFGLSNDVKYLYSEYTKSINSYMSSVINCSAYSLHLLKDINDSARIEKLLNQITNLTHLHLDCSRAHIDFYYHQHGFFDYFESNKGKTE